MEEATEPKIKMKKSSAKKPLCEDLAEGRVSRKAKDANGRSTRHPSDICDSQPEFKECQRSKFSSRLSSLRKSVSENLSGVDIDLRALKDFISRHPVSHTTSRGPIQWQGSDAQKLVKEELASDAREMSDWEA